jgi:outer membrane protein OmpA-like peptidoglycan-associated protein
VRASYLASFLLPVVATLLLAGEASAQTTTTGFALDRFNPSERGSEWFSEDTLDLRGDPGAAVGIVGELAERPLVLYNPDGSTRAVPVHDQLILHPGGSVTLFTRLRLGIDIPIAAQQSGTTGTGGGVTFPGVSSGGVGDLRLSADVRLAGEYGGPISVAIGAQFFVPTGNSADYLGDGSFHAMVPRVLVAGQIDWFAYAAHVGFHYRGLNATVSGADLGSEFAFGASAGVRTLEKKLLVGPEVYGSTSTNSSSFSTQTTPVELLLGAHYTAGSNIRIGAGVAPGLTRAYGEPSVRYLLSLEWVSSPAEPPPPVAETAPEPPPPPPPPPPDRDKDGIPDADDACPDVAGVKTDDPKTNGCPPDRDHDGVLDADDACPDVPGLKTDDPKTNGCPDPDRDKDGIPNEQDACPDAPGPHNADPKKNGCPAAAVVGKQIVILEQVKFATGSAAILPASNGILTAVQQVLEQHPDIKHVRIEGHTDNVGAAAMNKALSTKRAASVVAWLVKHGIDAGRLTSQGFGMERPVDTNDTPQGRQNNRRVEFHIEDEAGK